LLQIGLEAANRSEEFRFMNPSSNFDDEFLKAYDADSRIPNVSSAILPYTVCSPRLLRHLFRPSESQGADPAAILPLFGKGLEQVFYGTHDGTKN